MMGAGVNTADSVPCAIAIAYYSFEPRKCALLCANLGGDTDTIGAMATAICGGIKGVDHMQKSFRSIFVGVRLSEITSISGSLSVIRLPSVRISTLDKSIPMLAW